MKNYIYSILFIASCTIQLFAAPQTLYVSITGNDANIGSLSLPFRTISKAVSQATPGTFIYVRSGTYNEFVTLTVSGNAIDGNITITNYPSELPILDGTGLTVPSGNNGLFLLKDVSYIEISGFEICNLKTTTKSNVPVGIHLLGIAHHIKINKNKIHNIEHNGTTSSGTDAHGIAVYGTSGTQSINNIVISNNELYNLKLGSSESLVMNGNVELFEISGNIIHDNNNIAIDAIGFEGTAPANDQARNGIICDNTVYNIDSYGNVAYGTDRSADGIYVDGGTNIIIERNIVHNSNIGIELASEHAGKSTSNVVIRSNFVYLCDIAGIAIGGYNTKRGSTDNCRILNNTLYQNDALKNGNGELYIQFDTRNNFIVNNIIYANSQNIFMTNSYTQNTGNFVDRNLYYSASGQNVGEWQWKNVSYTGFAAYKTATKNDTTSIFADPKLNPLGFSIFPITMYQSPALDAGIIVDSIGIQDIAKNPRVLNNKIDIGASENPQLWDGVNESMNQNRNYLLMNSFPNPFNPSTTINFELPKSSNVKMEILDITGGIVSTVANGFFAKGKHQIVFNAEGIRSGIYFCRLTSEYYTGISKLVLLK